MRDMLFLAIMAVALPASISHPWIGIMVWNVLSIMNPHRYMWMVTNWPIAAATACAIFVGLLVTRDKRSFPVSAPTIVLCMFIAWICITYPFSYFPDGSWERFVKVMKIQVMILVTLLVLHEKRHLDILVWVLVVSLGYYGVKGGVFTALHGGEYRVWGPPGTFIEDNNELALALLVVIPLMYYLQLTSPNKWVRRAMPFAMILCVLSALGSHSRGAFLTMGVLGFLFWLRTKNKLLTAPILVVLALVGTAFMPESWHQRMETIGTYEEDTSAMGRINAWWTMFNLAKARLLGGGFDIYRPEIFSVFAPDPTAIHAAHSIYFQVMGELGFIGFFLFLMIWFLSWNSARWVSNAVAGVKELEWALHLSRCVRMSLVAYCVGGAFYSLAYFDLPYNLLVIAVVMRKIVEGRLAELGVRKPYGVPLTHNFSRT